MKQISLADIEKNPWKILEVKNPSKAWVKEAVKRDRSLLRKVPQTKELCLTAIELDGQAIRFVDEKFQTEKLQITAVKKDPHALKHIKHNQRENVVVAAVKTNGLALEFVKNKTIKVCKIAYESHAGSITFWNKWPDELIRFVISDDPENIALIQDDSPQTWLTALETNPRALNYIFTLRQLSYEDAVSKLKNDIEKNDLKAKIGKL